MGMHVWKLDLNQQKKMYTLCRYILFFFRVPNPPPFFQFCLPIIHYLLTNRIELDLHRNWVNEFDGFPNLIFCSPPYS